MPVIGDQSRFAVEYQLNENHGGAWMFGRFCYWCGGQPIGDYELGTSLRDVLFQLDQLAKFEHPRAADPRFDAMPASAAFRLLRTALFGATELDNAEVAEEEGWARHIILPPVDVFDHWKGFLLEDEQAARFIFAREPYLEIKEVSLKSGEVDAVLDMTRTVLSDIYDLNDRAKEE